MPGKTISLREGSDVLLISTGPQSVRCLQAAELLQGQGVSAGVLHLPSIKPINKEEIVSASGEGQSWSSRLKSTLSTAAWAAWLPKILSEASPRRVVRFGIEDRWGNRRQTIICSISFRCLRHA